MVKNKSELLATLKTIEGSGSFLATGVKNFQHPGLQIKGLGNVALPMLPSQAQEIIGVAQKAPFGKGGQTITDTSVRSAWEIDAAQLVFSNPAWEPFLKEIVEEAQQQLGLEAQKVKALPYKLLLYEAGDFFLPHKDSEKEKGMFGTLVVGLPALHTGGELHIRFDGRAEMVDFSKTSASFQIPYAAFYADCDHEIKPVTFGYRLALVYNLVQVGAGEKKVSSPSFGPQVDKMAYLLESLAPSLEQEEPLIVLLEHQYTPANLSLEALKGHDRPRAEALLAAAARAGYFAIPCLVTHYMMGDLEEDYDYYSRRRKRHRYWEEEEVDSDGSMGEVHEFHSSIEHWGASDMPGWGNLDIEENNLLTDIELGQGEPLEKAAEGYTGNAGMTIEYWYHYGAICLWHKSQHPDLLESSGVGEQLQWLGFYLKNWGRSDLQSPDYARKILGYVEELDFSDNSRTASDDYGPMAIALVRLADAELLNPTMLALLARVFEKIDPVSWLTLFQSFAPMLFAPVFKAAAARKKATVTDHLLNVMMTLQSKNDERARPFLQQQIAELPAYLAEIKLPGKSDEKDESSYYRTNEDPKRAETVVAILQKTLSFSESMERNDAWLGAALDAICRSMPRKFVHKVMASLLLRPEAPPLNVLANALCLICKQVLEDWTAVKPTTPTDWRREVPKAEHYKNVWETLRPFLESPVETVFHYRQPQAQRSEMESAISNVTIDLSTETIRSGSPHTLRLTKTQDAYQKLLREWKEDVALLERFEAQMRV